MAGYVEIEQKLAKAKTEFKTAFDSVGNARIIKTQRNDFALRFKYLLLILLCVAVIAAIIIFQVAFKQFDALYIVCESIIFVALTVFIGLLAISWRMNVRNAKCAEIIEYYNGKTKCLYSEIEGGGYKVEWKEARFFFTPKGEAELFESSSKTYSPFSYKKIRGHSRNYVLLDADAIIANFFEGAEVLDEADGVVTISGGFRYKLSDGKLEWFEIVGMYSECYENNFPIWAPLSAATSYTFRYEFTNTNRVNYKIILPEITRDACKYYFLDLPAASDDNILIENLRKN